MKARLAILLALATFTLTMAAQQTTPPATTVPPVPHGTVVFSRSTGDATISSPAPASIAAIASSITDADRAAITFTRYALDVRLRPEEHGLSTRARLTVRNDSDRPLQQLPLQLSSSLHWEQVRIVNGGRSSPAKFVETTIASDVDHTGQLHEAAIELLQRLSPGAQLELDVVYSGTIPQDAKRLEQIGTPPEVAQHSDWDEVSSGFTGLRGFGNVVWYPVSSVPVRLGDGDKLFAEIGRGKMRQANADVTLTVTAETLEDAPDIAILNGTVTPITFTPGDVPAHVPGIAKAALPSAPLGFQALSIFLASRQKRSGNALAIYARPEDEPNTQAYLAAGSMVTPLLRTWLESSLPDRPKAALSVLDLAQPGDAPFEERQTLYTTLQPVSAEQLTAPMSHSLAHGYFQSPRPWLNEGVAHFMASLWIEQTHDRATALAQLDEQRSALALAEPGDGASDLTTSASARPDLLHASDAIFYRTKATYVLWMLRELIGDDTLQRSLKAYDPSLDSTSGYVEQLIAKQIASAPFAQDQAAAPGSPAVTTAAVTTKELHQFFEDWVYTDRGLPDLTITGAFPSKTSAQDSYLIAVEVTNSGGAGADVPVTIRSATTQITERMYVPAHGQAVRRILIQGEPTEVQVNDGVLPETTASEHVQQIHYRPPSTP